MEVFKLSRFLHAKRKKKIIKILIISGLRNASLDVTMMFCKGDFDSVTTNSYIITLIDKPICPCIRPQYDKSCAR